MRYSIVIVNFGGPRSLAEVKPFLCSLLTDKDVIRTSLPGFLQDVLFKKIATKRADKISKQYAQMGGASPIFKDTEAVANCIREKRGCPVITFHRYLPATHAKSLELIEKLESDRIIVFPMFPQFTYATTGSIARFFQKKLSLKTSLKMQWLRSYADHPVFIQCYQQHLLDFLQQSVDDLSKVFALFSAHGIPQKFVETGDPYPLECQRSFEKVMKGMPFKGMLCYQSKFGPGAWLKPYTEQVCSKITEYIQDETTIAFVPLSFTSDHIETLVEVEEEYMPLIELNGLTPLRVPAFNQSDRWIEAILTMLEDFAPSTTRMLIRN